MKKILVMASMMMLGASGAWALGTDAGTVIDNNATLSYSAGGVAQPDVNTTAPDSFVVDKKIDMILETDDGDQIEVTPGQTDRITHYTFKNEGNADQNFTFSSSNLANGGEADYDTDADNEEISNRVISCTGGTPDPATSAADGTITIEVGHTAGTDDTLTCTLSVTIPDAAAGGADGDIMNVELLATAVDATGLDEVETTAADTQSGIPDIVFADGEAVQNGSTAGNLGDTKTDDNSTNGDTNGDGKDAARSGYIISTPVLSVVKTSCVISDPVNNITNPKRIPGAIIRYMFDIDNQGTGDVSDLNITDAINANLFVGNTKASAKKDENRASCSCGTEPATDVSGDTTIAGQNLLIEKIDVAHGSTAATPGHNHTCVSVEVEIN